MSAAPSRGAVARALSALHSVEDVALALLLGAMVLLAPLQIFLRNFFDEGLTWADPLLRVLVLWVGMLGAVSASRGSRHISIDVISKFVGARARAGLGFLTSLFAALVSASVAYHSGRFVATEREYQSIAFSGVEAWLFEIVIPFSFAAIALRYLLHAALDAQVLLGRREESQVRGGPR